MKFEGLTNREKGLWAQNVAQYVDRIQISAEEFSELGSLLSKIFTPAPEQGELRHRIEVITDEAKLCSNSLTSLRDGLFSLAQVYDEPEMWIESHKTQALLKFISENALVRADQFIHSTDQEGREYARNQNERANQAKETQSELDRLTKGRHEKCALIRGLNQKTLDEQQMLEEMHLVAYVLDHNLQGHRDSTVPISEDVGLLEYLLKCDEHKLAILQLQTLYRESKFAEMVFLSHGLKKLENIHPEFQDEQDVKFAAIKANPAALQHLDGESRQNSAVMTQLIDQNVEAVRAIGSQLRSDEQFHLNLIARNPRVMAHCGDRWRNHRDFILKALEINPL